MAHGFFQDSAGNLIAPIDFPGATGTYPHGLNDQGQVVGRYYDDRGLAHGFLRRLPDFFLSFDYPHAILTDFDEINNRGLICGHYEDDGGRLHGFIARLKRKTAQ
jgi:hypothetical protein